MSYLSNKLSVSGVMIALFSIPPAMAQSSPSSLDTIISNGKLVVCTSFSTPPYGITDENLQPAGFDIAVANLLARELAVELELVDVASQARIPSLTAGNCDILISSFGITAERAKTVWYSVPIYIDTQTVIAPSSTTFSSYEDLVGKNIGVTRGSTNDTLLTENALPGTNIMRFEDAATGNQALFSGQVDGIVSGTAAAFTITKETDAFKPQFPMRSSPMGVGVRKGESDLLQWINTAIMLLWNSGELQAAQQEWIGTVNEDLPSYWF
ncbi:transporter substrate-binding domain-containing protein [Pelagibacterium sp. H642]|uniref:transporter substrate-binding domain-containing protein n=1 Tax=Pelagibacterium sp. H642 TaxID=1881069 RepID=UPI002815A5F9|nr:transporter substrate-binding domain-containing protein [Pelagibacterium sp. H642]WMT91902.1 transporter substrate-binding domain-containing protein [Pelagibacterium sp. H642]